MPRSYFQSIKPALCHPCQKRTHLLRIFTGAFYAFTFALIFCRPYGIFLAIFYGLVLPSGATLLYLHRPRWIWHPALLATYAFLAYCAVSLIQNAHDDPFWCLDLLKKIAVTFSFLLLAVLFFLDRGRTEKYMHFSVIWALAGAILSIAVHHEHLARRLEPLGQLHHPIIGACVYGVFGLFALHKLTGSAARHLKILYGMTAAIVALLVVLTQSKGPMIALFLGYVTYGFLALKPKSRIVFAALVALVTAAGVGVYKETNWLQQALPAYSNSIAQRGMSFRPQIWAYTWEQIKQRPVFGYGLANTFYFEAAPDVVIPHPHNLYLATLYYTGIVGLVLEVAMVVFIYRGVWADTDRRWKRLALALLIYICLAMLSDNARLITSPKELLFIFWMPMAMLIARRVRSTRGAS